MSSRPYTRFSQVTLLIYALLLTAVLYGRARSLPFFFDDLDHFPYIARTPLSQIWQSAGGFPYFRPLGATLWRLSYLLFGSNNAAALHTLNLLLHALNGFLVGLLAIPIQNPKSKIQNLPAFMAATLFITYPFSYQAVPWIGALYHLLVTTLVLLALLADDLYRHGRQVKWLIVALIAATLAPFAHENGVIIFPLILIRTFLFSNPQSKITNLKSQIPWLLPLLIWFPIWFWAPKARTASFTLNHLEAIWQNSAYYLQGLGYPLTWIGGFLRDHYGLNDLVTAVCLALLALLIAAIVLQNNNQASLVSTFLWPIAFFTLTAAPAILLLSFAYNISSPRLQMLPSVGAAWLWANVVAKAMSGRLAAWSNTKFREFLNFAAVTLVVIAVGASISFIQRHMGQHRLLGEAWQQAAEISTVANTTGRSVIFINLPASLSHPTTLFPLGHEGTVFMVPYIHPDRIVDTNTGHAADFDLRRYEDIRPEMPYLYGVLGDGRDWPELVAENPQALIYNTHYTAEAIFLERVGALREDHTEDILMRTAAYGLQLQNAQVINIDNQTLLVKSQWLTTEPLPWEWTFFVHIVDANGSLIAQADGHVWANSYPLAQWPLHTAVIDQRLVQLPHLAENVTVRVGVYNWATGERMQLFNANGTAVTDNIFSLPQN